MKKSDPPIIVEQTFKATKEQLWSALTELDQLHKWFFADIPVFQPKEGFKTSFAVSNEGRTFTHLWTLTEVIPNQKITYNWKYEEWPGDSFVTFEILEKNGQNIVRLSTKVIEDFPQDIPEFKRESGIGGWNYFIKESLVKHMREQF